MPVGPRGTGIQKRVKVWVTSSLLTHGKLGVWAQPKAVWQIRWTADELLFKAFIFPEKARYHLLLGEDGEGKEGERRM